MSNFKKGDTVDGEVTGITKYGVFVRLEDNYNGLVHISEISDEFVSDINSLYSIGNIIKVKILDIDEDKLHVKLSLKKTKQIHKKNRRTIVENGTGFAPLEKNLPKWIDDKLEEIEKSDKNK